jgi:hypothetical protein
MAKERSPEQPQIHRGRCHTTRITGKTAEQRHGQQEQAHDRRHRERRTSDILHADLQQRDTTAEQQEAGKIEGDRAISRHILHEAHRQHDADQPERQVHVEDPAPGRIGRQQATEQRPDDRTQDGRHRHIGHRGHELAAREASQQNEPADRRHHGAADALQHTCRYQHRECAGNATERRADGEDRQRQDEDTACAEAVGEPTAQRYENSEGQHISGHCQIHSHRRGRQAVRHGRDRRGYDRRIELFHQERNGDDQRDENAQPRITLNCKAMFVQCTTREQRRRRTINPLRVSSPARVVESNG